MKTITHSLVLLAFAFACALKANATASWAAVYSTAYEEDTTLTTESRANYTAYYFTASTASSLFNGATSRADIESYLSDSTRFTTGKAALGTSGTALTGGDYALNRYQFIEYSGSAIANGSYFAVAFYKDEAFRVFDTWDTDLLSNGGNLLFTDKGVTQGDWIEITDTDIPEPTSGILLLLGLAGVALKRKMA